MENDSSSAEIGETPHVSCHKKRNSSLISGSRIATRSSYDMTDSGYITMTPHSANLSAAFTPVQIGGSACRLRSGCSSNATSSSLPRRRYHHRSRTSTELWQSDRASRFRSKFYHSLDASESADCSSSSSAVISVGAVSAREIQINNHRRGATTTIIANNVNTNVVGSVPAKRNISSELDGLLRAQLRSTEDRLAVPPPTAPASTLQLLSPPPSPAAPSISFGANEPIDEDVEMKLVIVPQSTPHLDTTDKNNPASPTSSRPTPSFSSSIESRAKLSKLVITDLRESDIRPKRLDFSQKPKYGSLRRSRALPNLAGKTNVDFMSILGEESDHWRVVSKILALLTPKDLCSISMVSKTWRRICAGDSRANMRRLSYVIVRQNIKENLKLIQAKAKAEGDSVSSPERRYERKGLLVEVQNLLQVPAGRNTPSSPPVSPSKVKFHSFIKAGRTLEPSEHLLRCPRCSFACQLKGENMASCSRQGCSMEFCRFCSARHTGPCKTALLATPTKRNKRLIAGSRQSKRNLRRL